MPRAEVRLSLRLRLTMAVTELALLHVLSPFTISSPELLDNLRKARAALESFDNRPFHFLRSLDGQHHIYIIGSWPSIKHHLEEYIPGEANRKCLVAMQDQVEVKFMFHVDLNPEEISMRGPLLRVQRYVVVAGEEETFQSFVEKEKEQGKLFAGGWRADNGTDAHDEVKNEYIVFSELESENEIDVPVFDAGSSLSKLIDKSTTSCMVVMKL